MRIIAGVHRGRRLIAPRGSSTRPTTDRVREALFAILGDLSQARILDAYAGSGALGMEALSRGAARCVFVESRRDAVRTITTNLQALGLQSQAVVIHAELERCKGPLEHEAPYDVVLADPPWPIADTAARLLLRVVGPLLSPQATVVIGHPRRQPVKLGPELGFAQTQTRHWGDSAMSWYLKSDFLPPSSNAR